MPDKQIEIAAEMLNGVFIWDYKKGDNIIYNLNILWSLYQARYQARIKATHKELFNKPIMLIIVSIIECILDDFIERVQKRSRDPLPNLMQSQITNLKYKRIGGNYRIKKLKKFNHYITQIQRQEIFGPRTSIYDALDLLRDIRNRIHIQNNKNILDADEFKVFTNKNLKITEKVFRHIIKTMIIKFPRKRLERFKLDDFPFPFS